MFRRHAHSGGIRVLVVDDDASIRALLQAALEEEGWLVEQHASGAEALLATCRATFDVVVLDLEMPGLTGLEVARRLVADGYPAALVLFSSCLTPEVRRECKALSVLAVDKLELPALVAACRHAARAKGLKPAKVA